MSLLVSIHVTSHVVFVIVPFDKYLYLGVSVVNFTLIFDFITEGGTMIRPWWRHIPYLLHKLTMTYTSQLIINGHSVIVKFGERGWA